MSTFTLPSRPPRPPQLERRRRDVRGRIARLTWPLRNGALDFAEHFPCNVWGHRWTEIPPSQLTQRERVSRLLYFRCGRTGCPIRSAFTN